MTTYTNNFAFPLQALNENSGTWGIGGSGSYPANPGPGLNNGIFSPLDSILGANIPITISNGSNSISLVQWFNKIFTLSGTLTANATVVLPFSPNASGSPQTPSVGGEFIVVNNTTGNFSVTVTTAAAVANPSGNYTSVTVPQTRYSSSAPSPDTYLASLLYSDGLNVRFADKGSVGFAQAVNGNPNGLIAGVAGSINTNAQLAYDYANGNLYVCTSTGIANGTGQAVWVNPVSSGQSLPQPEGYLTLTSNTPISTGSVLSATAIYYTQFNGAWTAINSGSGVVPFKFTSQFQLNLSSSQSANQIYDIYLIYSGGAPGSGTPVIAGGVAWSINTPGSCSRGTGGGTAQLQRDSFSGLWVNAQTQNMVYNNGSINGTASVPAGGGVYLGSIVIDGTNGQISCNRDWGNSPVRKWGVWNAYNRTPITMLAGDSTALWNYNVNTWRQSNANSNNTIQAFTGLQEEIITVDFSQNATILLGCSIGIGLNSTTSPVGFRPQFGTAGSSINAPGQARIVTSPLLGVNYFNMLEIASSGGPNETFNGTESNMIMTTTYRG